MRTMLPEYDRVVRQCAAEDLDYPRYLLRMAAMELLDGECRATEHRIRQVKFSVTESLDSFDFLAMPTLNECMMLEPARCEFLGRRQKVLLLRNSGTGKTHIALVLGLAGCQQVYLVRLTHHVHILGMKGDSFRLKQSRHKRDPTSWPSPDAPCADWGLLR